MYKKPTFTGYNNGKEIGYKESLVMENENNTIRIKNVLLGVLEFDDYHIRVFTMSNSDIDKYPPYFLLTKDYYDNRDGKMVCVSALKPEYIKLNTEYRSFKLNKDECEALYKLLCSYDYSKAFPGYLYFESFDKGYTQYTNYISLLNWVNNGRDDWREIPLDTGCPKYTKDMGVYKEKKEIDSHEYNG